MAFQPGKSGNPGGRPKAKPFQDALLIEALSAERGEPCEALPGSLRWNARQLLTQGDVQSIKELADRLDGKPSQQLELEHSGGVNYVVSGEPVSEADWLKEHGSDD